MAMPPQPVPSLVDDVVEEILLRCPPDDPARLVRAALVCKPWHRLVSSAGFRRRFREFHRRRTPLLGFLPRHRAPAFQPTSSFRPRLSLSLSLPLADPDSWRAVDARHGRVLIGPHQWAPAEASLTVWCPVTGELWMLPMPRFQYERSWTAALVCAAAGCDHLDCGCGAFVVVFVGTDRSQKFTSSCAYSFETRAWSEVTSVKNIVHDCIDERNSAFAGNAVYFHLVSGRGILKHDLVTGQDSVIGLPRWCLRYMLFTAWEEGGIGAAAAAGFRLFLWSREDGGGSGGDDAGWIQSRVIELKAFFLGKAPSYFKPEVIGFEDAAGVVFIQMSHGQLVTFDIKSGCVREVGNGFRHQDVVPYVNFCTPVL